MKTLKKIASSLIAVLIFITVPSILVAAASGYNEIAQYGIYTMIVLGVPYYFLNRGDDVKEAKNVRS